MKESFHVSVDEQRQMNAEVKLVLLKESEEKRQLRYLSFVS